jgi:hypothetical protein
MDISETSQEGPHRDLYMRVQHFSGRVVPHIN